MCPEARFALDVLMYHPLSQLRTSASNAAVQASLLGVLDFENFPTN